MDKIKKLIEIGSLEFNDIFGFQKNINNSNNNNLNNNTLKNNNTLNNS